MALLPSPQFNVVTAETVLADVSASTSVATGSDTSRTLASQGADESNVKNFGAKGDGVTDDTAAIRLAVAEGGVVYFPPGQYIVSGQPIEIISQTRLTGAGPNVSVIVAVNLTAAFGGSTGSIFANTAIFTYGYPPTVITPPPSPLPDHDITVDNLGIEMSNSSSTISCSAFTWMYLKNYTMTNVIVNYNGTLPRIDSCKFIGCDSFMLVNYRAYGVANAVDCFLGTNRGKIINCYFVGAFNGTNGALVNWNAYFNVSDDLQIINTTFWLNNCFAMDFDALSFGAMSQNILVSNCVVSARSGTGNLGIICRGNVNRLKVRGISFDAQPGADMNGLLIGDAFSPTASTTGTNLITTVNGSSQITVSYPGGCELGAGNYMSIAGPSSATLVGNGLSLNGYYEVLSASPWPPTVAPNGSVSNIPTSFVIDVSPQVATSSGTISGTTHMLGFYGTALYCDFHDLTYDGIHHNGNDLIQLIGVGFTVSGVTVTNNYNGFTTPQYRAILSFDGTPLLNNIDRLAPVVSNIVGAPGLIALQAGWQGNNTVTWSPFTPYPVFSSPNSGTFTPALVFGTGPSTDIVYTEQSGNYTKTGPMVFFSLNMAISSIGATTGAATISGFPLPIAVAGGAARGSYTANFGSKLSIAPSSTTTPDVYVASVGILSYTIASAGSGGTSGNYALSYSGGTGSGASANFSVEGATSVASLTIASGGSGGTNGTYNLIFTGTGTGASGQITVTGGAITEQLLNSGGTGYTTAPTVSFTVPGLTGASVTATLGTGAITSVSPVTRGTYTVAPTLGTSACPGLTGASVTATVNTVGIAVPMEVIIKFINGAAFLALDVDANGFGLTSEQFAAGDYLRMTGWYFTSS